MPFTLSIYIFSYLWSSRKRIRETNIINCIQQNTASQQYKITILFLLIRSHVEQNITIKHTVNLRLHVLRSFITNTECWMSCRVV